MSLSMVDTRFILDDHHYLGVLLTHQLGTNHDIVLVSQSTRHWDDCA